MSTTVKFLILYLIPILSFASIFGVYMLSYGKSLGNSLIDFAFRIVILGFIASCFIVCGGGVKLRIVLQTTRANKTKKNKL